MANELVYSDVGLIIGTSTGDIDVTVSVTNIQIGVERELLDITAMGNSGWRSRIAGLKDWTAEVELNDNFESLGINETVWNVWERGTNVNLTMRIAQSLSRGTTNPEFYGPATLPTATPVTAQVGQVAKNTLSFQGAGQLNRYTSST